MMSSLNQTSQIHQKTVASSTSQTLRHTCRASVRDEARIQPADEALTIKQQPYTIPAAREQNKFAMSGMVPCHEGNFDATSRAADGDVVPPLPCRPCCSCNVCKKIFL
mmetsp:Transcript_122475/g.224581  ORF Transcript_122475/g.224581 Transcript_122475/m.224581 type:complete len:108 (+) Transcript_122475:3-326(+)